MNMSEIEWRDDGGNHVGPARSFAEDLHGAIVDDMANCRWGRWEDDFGVRVNVEIVRADEVIGSYGHAAGPVGGIGFSGRAHRLYVHMLEQLIGYNLEVRDPLGEPWTGRLKRLEHSEHLDDEPVTLAVLDRYSDDDEIKPTAGEVKVPVWEVVFHVH